MRWYRTGKEIFELRRRIEAAPAHDRPSRVACEHPAVRFDLIVEVREARGLREPAEGL